MTPPSSTYRLQLHSGFGLADAAAITDYLHDLGVGAVYTSPLLRAQKGSTHGYDVVDHTTLGPELGDEAAYEAWSDGLRARGMGHVLDMVPNHMGIGSGENAWWSDVLESGQASRFAGHFDIAWEPPKPGMRGKLLLPVLGRPFGEALEAGELKVMREGGRFVLGYWERRLPLAIKSTTAILRPALAVVEGNADELALAELHSILTAIDHLPGEADTPPAEREARAREQELLKRRVERLLEQEPAIASAVDERLKTLGGREGDPRSFDALEQLLNAQVYRLAYWRVSTEEINYRRFFDVDELAAIKMEDPAVFAAAHAKIFEWVAAGRVTGLRLDHTDGLYEPAAYFAALQAEIRRLRPNDPCWLLIEKILEPGEQLPDSWDVDGTTGYDFLGAVNNLWVAPDAGPRLTDFYQRFVAVKRTFNKVSHTARLAILHGSLSSEVSMLAHRLELIAGGDRRSRDFTRVGLTAAIEATIAAFPVYRTYVRPDGSHTPEDVACIERALGRARRRQTDVDPSVFDYLRDVLLLKNLPEDEGRRGEIVDFAMRFAQITGPAIAKGVEDTALYRYNRLVCLNEVGGDPGAFGGTVEAFHAHNVQQRRRYPHTMLATSTHDTKRGEDLRCRLAVLTEVPDAWRRAVSAWGKYARLRKTEVDGEPAPSRNDVYLFYQTVVGAFPLHEGDELDPAFVDRVAAYMQKATKEAKLRTSWLHPNEAYDAAVQKFVREMLAHPEFVAEVRALARRLDVPGAVNSLAQLIIKMGAPGVPDTYQGSELWNFSLVDPDNRRPVEFNNCRRLLAEIKAGEAEPRERARSLLAGHASGGVKLLITHVGLMHRREQERFYREADYVPISGGRHVVAFRRERGAQGLVCAVPRLSRGLARGGWPLGEVWGDEVIEVGPGRWRDLLTGVVHDGPTLRVAEVFADLPGALLWRDG